MYGVDTAHTRAHRATYLPKQQLDNPTLPGADQWTQGKGWQFEVADSGLKGMDKAQGDEGEKQWDEFQVSIDKYAAGAHVKMYSFGYKPWFQDTEVSWIPGVIY
jgi:hypothetical protein